MNQLGLKPLFLSQGIYRYPSRMLFPPNLYLPNTLASSIPPLANETQDESSDVQSGNATRPVRKSHQQRSAI